MRWRGVIVMMIACCFCARSVHAEAGGTTVAVDDANVTIAVHLDLCCTQDASEVTVWGPLIQAQVKAAEDMWNAGLASFAGKGCYNLRVVFDVRLLKQGEPYGAGRLTIPIDLSKPGRSLSHDPDMKNQNEDTETVYHQTLDGEFYASDMDFRTWAHEIGHLMGLGDDYYESPAQGHPRHSCLPGRDASLMCHHSIGSIDQNLADRLADILNIRSRLPTCWIGTAHSDTTGNHAAGAMCSGEGWDHKIQFIIAGDNQVKGTATSGRVSMPTCTGPGSWVAAMMSHQATAARFQITGEQHGLDIQLRFAETFIDGGTAGLINYSLGLALHAPILTVPLITFESAKGVAETNV